MHILFVAARFPYPPLRGDQVRSYHFLRLLRRRHRVTLVTPHADDRIDEAHRVVQDLCDRWVSVPISRRERLSNLCRFPFSTLPIQVLYFCPPSLSAAVEDLVGRVDFDVVHVQLARMAPSVLGARDVPRVIDFIDALSLNMQRRAESEAWPLRAAFRAEGERMRRYEQELIRRFDAQVVAAAPDKRATGDHATTTIIPNGVSVDDFPYVEEGRQENLILFSGRMGYFPNAEAAVYFARQVFPLIRQAEPGARFLIVGADPPAVVQKLVKIPGVEVVGQVPRMHDFLRQATVAVAPMLSGTGIQNKVLEAMASGTPVVATPLGAAGIEAVAGQHLLVAAQPRALADSVVRLLRDAGLRRRLAVEGRDLIESKYTWERSVDRLEKVYDAVVRTRSAASRGSHVADGHP